LDNGIYELPEDASGIIKVLEQYRVRPEGQSLEEWYMSQGPITPPASEIPSGPPSSWGAALEPIPVKSGGTDVPYDVVQPTIQTVETVSDIMQTKGFLQGEYGGWFKPSTQETRPLVTGFLDQGKEQLDNTTNGSGGAGEGLFGGNGDLSILILAIAAAIGLG